jgi:hypothetical protein
MYSCNSDIDHITKIIRSSYSWKCQYNFKNALISVYDCSLVPVQTDYRQFLSIVFVTHRGARGSILKVEGHWPKGALLYMTKIERFYVVHEPNEIFWKYGTSMTSEMAFTESLLLQKGHFLSSKRGRSLQEYFFRSLNGALQPRKKGTFSLFEKVGGGHTPHCPPPGSAAPGHATMLGYSV